MGDLIAQGFLGALSSGASFGFSGFTGLGNDSGGFGARFIEENGSLLDLGISHAQIDTVIREFYEDLDLGVAMARTLDQRLTAADLSRLLGEISDPALQQGLLKAMLQIVVANDQLSAGETRLLREALLQWTCDEGVGSFPFQAQVPCRRVADRLS